MNPDVLALTLVAHRDEMMARLDKLEADARSLNDYALELEGMGSTRAAKARFVADQARDKVIVTLQAVDRWFKALGQMMKIIEDAPDAALAAIEAFEPPPSPGFEGFVYFIRREYDGAIKIGWSTDPDRRREQLLTGAGPCILLAQIPASRSKERELHRHFKAQRIHGEWFRLNDEMLELIGRYNVA